MGLQLRTTAERHYPILWRVLVCSSNRQRNEKMAYKIIEILDEKATISRTDPESIPTDGHAMILSIGLQMRWVFLDGMPLLHKALAIRA